MVNNTTWIIVANSAFATIYRLVKFPKIEKLTSFEHLESRLHDQDLISSKPGRAFEKDGTRRSAYEPETDPKKAEIDKFARQLGSYLSSAHQKRGIRPSLCHGQPFIPWNAPPAYQPADTANHCCRGWLKI